MLLPALLVAAAMLLPPAYLVIRALERGPGEAAEVFSDPETLAVLGLSLIHI